MSRSRGALLILASLFSSSGARLAWADAGATPAPPAEGAEARARVLFREGNLLVENARYVDALEKFRAAYAAWQNPKIKLNIATTLVALGRNAEAFEAYRQYLGEAAPPAARRREVDAILREIEPRLGHVRVQLGAGVRRVMLDGRELEAGELDHLALDPGRHVLLAEGAFGEQVTSFEIGAGEHQSIVLRPRATAPRPEPGAAAPAAGGSAPAARLGWGLQTRIDIDGTGHGAVAAGGVALVLDAHWQVSAGALMGAHAGGWAGVQLALLEGPLQPTLGVSAPVFFLGAPHVGLAGEAGARWAVSRDVLFVSLRAALVHFPVLPEGYLHTVVVPSLGTELWL